MLSRSLRGRSATRIPAFAAGGAPPAPQCLLGGGFPPEVPRGCAHVAPPQLRAFAVTGKSGGRGRILPRPDFAASYSPEIICRYLSKNPVNLRKFIEIYGNSISASEALGGANHTEIPRIRADGICGEMRDRPRPMREESAGRGGRV